MYRSMLAGVTAVIFTFSSSESVADDESHAALLDLSERIFGAVASQDPEDWRALQLADGTTLSFRPDPDGAEGEMLMRMTTNEAFISGQKKSDHEYAEYWVGDPTVLVRGPIGVIWGEYIFTIDGEVSHCGVDAIDAVKVGGEWKMANIMWTVEQENCPEMQE